MEEEGSIAFMFMCCERPKRKLTGLRNGVELDEAAFFKENYPKTLLIGSMTGGEIYDDKTERSTSPDGTCTMMDLWFSFACVIFFLSVKKPR